MGKKNIQPTTSSPVSRTLVVAPRPALEELRAEPQEGHISSLTGPDPSFETLSLGPQPPDPTFYFPVPQRGGTGSDLYQGYYTSYDGDDE